MDKIILPQSDVSYYDASARRHVPCGVITGIIHTGDSEKRLRASMGETSGDFGNLIYDEYSYNKITGRGSVASKTKNKGEWGGFGVLSHTTETTYTVGQTLGITAFNHTQVTIKFTANVPSNMVMSIMLRTRRKRVIPDTLTLNVNNVPDVTIPVTKYPPTSKLITSYAGSLTSGAQIYLYDTGTYSGVPAYATIGSTVLYQDKRGPEDVFYVREYTYATGYSFHSVFIGVDTDGYHCFVSILDMLKNAGLSTDTDNRNIKLRTRNFTRQLEFTKPENVTVHPLSDFMVYDVGLVTTAKNVTVSEDGFTITGKFNSLCTVEHRFGTNPPVSFATETDGSFSYTSPFTYHIGGNLTLTPSNRVGSYAPTIVKLLDKISPNALTNITVTRTGFFATGEIGAIVSLYDVTTTLRIARYTIPSTGIVQITFTTTIPEDITSKDYEYTIEDITGNITARQLVLFSEVEDIETGPYSGQPSDIVQIDGVSSSATAVPVTV